MKTKRIGIALVAGAMSAIMLTSCSEAELLYWDFTNDIAKWNVYEGTGEMVIDVDKNTIADFINDVFIKSESSDDEKLTADDVPFENISLVYTAAADTVNNIYDINFDITVDDNETYTLDFYTDTEKVIFEKTFLDSIERFMNDYNLVDENLSYKIEFLKEYIKDKDSIEIAYDDTLVKNNVNNTAFIKEIVSVISEFFTTAFDGYTTNTLELNGENGVTGEFNYNNVVKAINDLFEYCINNSDKIYSEWDNIADDIQSVMYKLYPEYFNESDSSQFESYNVLPSVEEVMELQDDFNSLINDKSFSPLKAMLSESEYGFDIVKNDDNSYSSNSFIDLNYKGNDLVDIISKETNEKVEKLDVKEYDPFVFTDENEDMDEVYNEWMNIKYPANSVHIEWNKGNNYCYMLFIRPENYIDTRFETMVTIDDRIYVPMRDLAERMGYSVEWDAQNSKAYIVDNGQKFDVETIIMNDTAFVKVRDLEKLGLVIDYNENESENKYEYRTILCTAIVDK